MSEPERIPPESGWGPTRVLVGLGAVLGLAVVEAGVAAAFDPDLESLAATLTVQTLLAATLIGVAVVAVSPSSPSVLGLRRPVGAFVKATGAAYLAYFACALVIAATIQPEQEDITRELGADEGVLGSIAAGLLIVVAAPLSEEIFFRGFMFGGLRRTLSFPVAALIPSVIWAIFHYTGLDSWGVVLQLAVFGIALSWLYERTGSLWPPIALHVFNNALAFAILMSS